MEGELSSFLDDGSLPLNPVDGLPEPRQLQVDQVIRGKYSALPLTWGEDNFYVWQIIAGQPFGTGY